MKWALLKTTMEGTSFSQENAPENEIKKLQAISFIN